VPGVFRVLPDISTLQPELVPVRLQSTHKHVHRDLDRVRHAVTVGAPLAVLDPPLRGKIGRLGAVEALVEASVVAVWERDHDFPRLLCNLKISKLQLYKLRQSTIVLKLYKF